jgi:hypothetical protein
MQVRHTSFSISNDHKDFVGPINTGQTAHLCDLADSVRIKGLGQVAWMFIDYQGTLWTLTLHMLKAPEHVECAA